MRLHSSSAVRGVRLSLFPHLWEPGQGLVSYSYLGDPRHDIGDRQGATLGLCQYLVPRTGSYGHSVPTAGNLGNVGKFRDSL